WPWWWWPLRRARSLRAAHAGAPVPRSSAVDARVGDVLGRRSRAPGAASGHPRAHTWRPARLPQRAAGWRTARHGLRFGSGRATVVLLRLPPLLRGATALAA